MAKIRTAEDVATFLGSAKNNFARFSSNGVSVDLQTYLTSEKGRSAFKQVASSPFQKLVEVNDQADVPPVVEADQK